MSEEKIFFANEESKYGEGVLLDDYNGQVSLVSARRKDGGCIWIGVTHRLRMAPERLSKRAYRGR